MKKLWNTILHPGRYARQACDPDADFITHRPRKRRRLYLFPDQQKQRRIAVLLGICLCAAIFLFSAVKVASYAVSYFSARHASAAMRNAYHDDQPTTAETPAISASPTLTPAPTASPAPASAHPPAPTTTAPARLETARYPLNPYTIISASFAKIRRQNSDIVGWLTIDELLDEAVVQRDNEYYLNRDYRGYHNDNGALFLDQHCDLSTRPYTYLVYGHNMKSGLMFGALRNYEDITFYRNNPFITFDTIYEDGRYVIFAVATISTESTNWKYVNFTSLHSPVIAERQSALRALIARSRYECTIDVQPQDQLLLLITCVGDNTERRVIAARRIRDDETESALRRLVRKTTIR